MPKLRVHNFSVSLDGYGAGPNQDIDNPLDMDGGTTFHFVTEGINAALERAKEKPWVEQYKQK